MASDQMEETLLPKWLALPIFASDPLSSVAYATEAALVVLVGASLGAAHLVFPISLGIAALLAIVVASYRQTVLAYETLGRRVRRREGEPRQGPKPRCRGRAAHRLHPHRRRLRRGRRARPHLGRSQPARPRARAFARLRRADHVREPAWGEGGRRPLRVADLRVRRVDLPPRRDGGTRAPSPAAPRRSCRTRSPRAPGP